MTTEMTDEQCATLYGEAKESGSAKAQTTGLGTAEIIITNEEHPFVQWLEKQGIGHKLVGIINGWQIVIDDTYGDFAEKREGARLAFANGVARVLREQGMEVITASTATP